MIPGVDALHATNHVHSTLPFPVLFFFLFFVLTLWLYLDFLISFVCAFFQAYWPDRVPFFLFPSLSWPFVFWDGCMFGVFVLSAFLVIDTPIGW